MSECRMNRGQMTTA